MTFRFSALAGVCLCVAGVQAMAQAASLSNTDKQFMTMAATANMTEAHLGQMAESQAANANLKTFGQTLVQDHTRAYEELHALSNKTGENIPKGIDTGKDASIQQLRKLKGAGFDKRFVQHEIQDHQRVLAAFKREAEHGQNPDVKAYAQKLLPTIEEHLHKAQEIAKNEKHA
jgi:putative membrane protein